jgi:two-component system response regulator AtoC
MPDRILIVDDDEALRESLELVLGAEGYIIHSVREGPTALERLGELPVDVVLCDIGVSGLDGFDLLPQIQRRHPGLSVVLTSACGTDGVAAEAIRRGAWDYAAKPIEPSELLLILRNARERRRLMRENELLRRDVTRVIGDRPIVAASPRMIELLELLERTAAFKTAALLSGESGTGKEVLARAIHAQSARRAASFVTADCGAIPESLLESELFGHAKGAFAGADRASRGLVASAEGGTLYLDEIGELPLPLQAKLLRVLQQEEVEPVGEGKSQRVDVRVIAATARDLERDVGEGRFREDLFQRLNAMRLDVPALRERKQDIPLLMDHFLEHFRAALGKNVRSISDDALERLTQYRWPGNVRELENVIERALILADGERITLAELPGNIVSGERDGSGGDGSVFSLKRARRAFEAQMIRRALRASDGNRTHAARKLEISHRALLYKIKEYEIRD